MNYLDILKSEYEIIRPLSRGAHGECYLVRRGDFFASAKVYLKNAERECEHEAGIYKTLHGSLAKEDFFQAGRLNDAPILIMQTYEGLTLEEFFASTAYTEKTLAHKLSLLIRVCDAVSAMHERGILHLDIKPSNFYISKNENAIKPIDMGSAVLINREYKDIRDLLSAIGYHSTYGFCSKKLLALNAVLSRDIDEFTEDEKMRAIELEKSISVKDDIFSLISLIYNALTGCIFGDWLDVVESFYSPRKEVEKALLGNGIPDYLISPLCDLFMTLEDEVPFESVDHLISALSRILKIEENQGLDPLVFLRNARDKFLLPDDFDKNLLCPLEGGGSLSDYYRENPARLTYLVCEGGAGKTYQLHFLESTLFESGDFIPLYIPLASYDNSHTYIRDYILSSFAGAHSGSLSELSRVLCESKILLLIDGINETSYSPAKLHREIEELAKLQGLYILVTDRGDNMPSSDFTRISLNSLSNAFLKGKIHGFDGLNTQVKALLGLPFYFTHYTAIPENERGNIHSAASLLDKYYESLIKRAEKSAEGDDYRYFAKIIINEFLPYFAYYKSTLPRRLSFDAVSCSSLWQKFKNEHDIIYDKRCIGALLDFGVIKKANDDVYAFSHQNIFIYFAAKFLYNVKSDAYIKSVFDENILKMLGEMQGDLIFKKLHHYKNDFSGNASEIVAKYVQMLTLCGKNTGADLSNLDLRCVNLSAENWAGCDFSGSIFDPSFVTAPALQRKIQLCYTDGKVVVASDLYSRVLVFDMNLSIKAILSPKYYWASRVKVTDTHIYLIDIYGNEAYIHALNLCDFSQSVKKYSPSLAAEFAESLEETYKNDCGFKAWHFKNFLILQSEDGDYVRKINLAEGKPLRIEQVDLNGSSLLAGTRLYDTKNECFVREAPAHCTPYRDFNISKGCVIIDGVKIPVEGTVLSNGVAIFGDMAHILYFDDGLYLLKYNLKNGEREILDTDIELSVGEPDFDNLKVALSDELCAVSYNGFLHFYLSEINWSFSEFALLEPLSMDFIRGMKFCGDKLIILHDDNMVSALSLTLPEVSPPAGSRGVPYRAEDDVSYIHAHSRLYSYEIPDGDIVGNQIDEDVFEVFSKEPVAKIKKDFTLEYLEGTNLSRCDFSGCKIYPDDVDIPDEILFNT